MQCNLIKVCGMRDSENIRSLELLEPDWMGFICWPKSSRYVDAIPDYLPMTKRIGVFVNADIEFIKQKTEDLGLTHIQLHGDESADFCNNLKLILQKPIIKAISVSCIGDINIADKYQSIVDYLLFDTKCTCVGGSGVQFDWDILKHYKGDIPFLLSGGIGPNDAKRLDEFNHPACIGIDINSRFEDAPAMKNIDKIRDFFKQISHLCS